MLPVGPDVAYPAYHSAESCCPFPRSLSSEVLYGIMAHFSKAQNETTVLVSKFKFQIFTLAQFPSLSLLFQRDCLLRCPPGR